MAIKVYSPIDLEDTSSGVSIDGDFAVDTNTFFVDVSTDRVGIGTTSPADKLQVDGTIQVATATPIIKLNDTNASNTTNLAAYVSFQINGTENGWMGYGSSGNNSLTLKNNSGFTVLDGTSGILFSNSNTERMRITSTGNVGIGTTSPTAKLDVNGEVRFRDGNIRGNSSFDFLTTGDAAQQARFKGIQVSTSYSGNPPSNGILFGTDTNLYRSAANTLRTSDSLVVDSNVLVGTTTDSGYKLNVNGTARFTDNVTISSSGAPKDLIIYGNTAGEFMQYDGSASVLNIYGKSNSPALGIFVNGGAQPTDHQIKIGRDVSQYYGIRVDDNTALLVHRQDESGSNTHQVFNDIWTSASGSHSWRWRIADAAGGNASQKMKLTKDSVLTLGGGSNTITDTKAGQWDTAYGWGDHASAGYLTSLPSHNHDDRYYTETESDGRYWRTVRSVSLTGSNPFDDAKTETRVTGTGNYLINYTGASAQLISSVTGGSASVFQIGAHYNGSDFYMRTRTDSSNWRTWKKLWHSGNFTDNSTNWNTAYGWGDHASEGYLTSSSLSGYATESYVNTQVSNLVDSAPGTLDTLNELAAALGDDANFATTTSTALGNRLRVDTASQGLNSTQKSNARTNLGLGSAATSASTDFLSATGNDSTSGTITSSNGLGFRVDSNGSARIEIESGGDNWAYLRLKDDGTTSWDLASYNGGNFELRRAGTTTNRLIYTSGGVLTVGDGSNTITNTKVGQWDTAYGWGNHAGLYLGATAKAADSNLLDGIDSGSFLRSDASDSFSGTLSWSGSAGGDAFDLNNSDIEDARGVRAREFNQLASGVPRNNLGDPTVTEMALFDSQFRCMTDLSNDYNDLTDITFYKQMTSSSAWEEVTTYSDDQKRRFLRTNNSSVIIPNTAYKFRVEFNAKGYTFANAIYFYWSSNSHNTQVHIWKQRSDNDTWYQHTSSTNTVSSWPGHLWMPFGSIPWHETASTTSHFHKVRVEFTPNWSTGDYSDRDINLYGGQIWGGYPSGRRTPHYYDQNGKLYTWGDFEVNGRLHIDIRDSNTSSTTALVMNGNEVEQRTLGSAAFSATSAFATSAQGANADTAHGWGNHASAGYYSGTINLMGNDLIMQGSDPGDIIWRNASGNETHRIWSGNSNYLTYRNNAGTAYAIVHTGLSGYNASNWDTAYGWGNHAGLYLGISAKAADSNLLDGINSTSFLRSDAVDATLSGTILSTNNANVDGANFEVNTTNKTVNEYAYKVSRSGSAVGGIYIDGRGEFPSLTAGGATITASAVSNWNTAYGWGDHASEGYLTSSSLSGYATESYVNTQVSNLVDSAPGTLDTLNELAAALGDDANFSTTVTNSIATKLPLAGGTMSGTLNMNGNALTNISYLSLGNYEKSNLPTGEGAIIYDLNDSDAPASLGDYGGSHPDGVYLRSSSSEILTVYHTGHFTGTHIANWQTAYGWGNHASAGYLTSVPNHSAALLTSGTLPIARIADDAITGAKIAHNTLDAIHINASAIGASELNVSGNGSSGQVLTSDGDGTFSWTNKTVNTNTNYYLDGITKSGNTLTFSVNGATNQTYTFGSNAFNSTTIPTNNNQLTNGAGYITGISFANVSSKPDFSVNAMLSSRTTTSPDTSGDSNGVSFNYLSSSASNKPSGTDHSLMTLSYSNAWQTQLAQDWRNKGRMYLRGQNNGTWSSWVRVHSTDDFSTTDVANGVTAYGWGNHASAGYLTTETYTSHENTSNLSGVYGGSNNGVVIEDITVDANGHVTAVGTRDLDGRFAAASHNHTSLDLTGSIYNGNSNYSIDLKDHSDRTWFRNQVGGWVFQSGTSGDDWTQSFTFYLPAAGSTANNVWAEFGQRDSNDAAAGRYRGLRIVKDTGSVADGDLRAGAIYIGTTRKDQNWDTAYSWGNHASAGYITDLPDAGAGAGSYGSTSNGTKIDTITVDAKGRVTAVATGACGDITAVRLVDDGGSYVQDTGGTAILTIAGGTGITTSASGTTLTVTNDITNNNQLTNGAGYITGYTVTSSDVTTALGYTPYQESTALSATTGTFSGDITVNGNQVITSGSNADVKFSVWSGTTYGIGMTSGVTYGGLNDYAMTFCMNNDSDRGFWWGYSGQSKSSGAMSLTTAGVLTVASSITAGGAVTGSNLNVSNWDTAYGWGNHASAGYLTSFDITTQTDPKYLRSNANDTMSGVLTITGNDGVSKLRLEGTTPTIDLDDSDGDSFYIHVNSNNFYILADRDGGGNYGNWETPHPLQLEADTNVGYLFGNRIFADNYHPNADKWTTARTLSLTGDVTGSVSWDGSGNASITTVVADDSHNHTISNIDGLQSALDGKQAAGSYAAASHDHDRIFLTDSRGAARAPSYYNDRYAQWDFQNSSDTGAGGDTWHGLLTVAKWTVYDATHRQEQLAFTGNDLKRRTASSDSAWGSWKTILDSNNFSSWAAPSSHTHVISDITSLQSTLDGKQAQGLLDRNGLITTNDWNDFYTNDTLRVASAHNFTAGANNAPDDNYNYGAALTYRRTSNEAFQMYFPENNGNSTNGNRRVAFRTGWNGGWSDWRRFVDMIGNVGYVTGGNDTGFEVHSDVSYNQDPGTYFLLRGQADNNQPYALKILLTGNASGNDIEWRRLKMNGSDDRMYYAPEGQDQITFEYTVVTPSDARLKDNVKNISNPIEKLNKLNGCEFDWNSGVHEGKHDVGVIAQEVEAVIPEAVGEGSDGIKSVAYDKLVPLLIESVKEQQAMIQELKQEIQNLKNK